MKRMFAALVLTLSSVLAFALPSTDDVEAAVRAGNYAQADTMMQEVVAARPQSAKAHYFYAQILAHEGKFPDAAAQAQAARGIDPALSFTNPQKFREFEQEVLRAEGAGVQRAVTPAPAMMAAPHSGGIPGWVWVLGIGVIGFLVLRAATRRAQFGAGGMVAGPGVYPSGPVGPGGYPMPGGGYGYPGGAPMGSTGSSLLGTGLAAAGGVAAGMMAERYLEGRREEGFNPNVQNYSDNGAGAAASDLENRPVDFGGDVAGGWGGDSGGGSNFTPDGGSGDGGGW